MNFAAINCFAGYQGKYNFQCLDIHSNTCLDQYDIILINNSSQEAIYSELSNHIEKETNQCHHKLFVNILAETKDIYNLLLWKNKLYPLEDYNALPISFLRGNEVILEETAPASIKGLYGFITNKCQGFHFSTIIDEPAENFIPLFYTKGKNRILGGSFLDENNNFHLFIPNFYLGDGKIEDRQNNLDIILGMLISLKNGLDSSKEEICYPDWLEKEEYQLNTISEKIELIEKQKQEIKKIQDEKDNTEKELDQEKEIQVLLFGDGHPLENAIYQAMNLIGFKKTKGLIDGNDEIDVFYQDSNIIIIGEAKGAEEQVTKEKYSQLLTHSSNYEVNHEITEEKIIKILFGNAFKDKDVSKRTKETFSDYIMGTCCKKNVLLIRTPDLYKAVQKIKNNNDKKYAEECKKAILNCSGGIVTFP